MKIAVVSGGFDPLHSGHINLLESAASYGDKLVVLLNSDDWLARKKGRPFMPFKHAQNAIVYTEWFGSESFAGGHFPNDPKQLVLFDVNIHKKGLLKPKEFLDTFGHLKVAELIEKRILDDEFIEAVRNNEYECGSKFEIRNEVPEGVICKGGEGHNLWMCKIKTNDYREELKQRKGDDWTKYWE